MGCFVRAGTPTLGPVEAVSPPSRAERNGRQGWQEARFQGSGAGRLAPRAGRNPDRAIWALRRGRTGHPGVPSSAVESASGLAGPAAPHAECRSGDPGPLVRNGAAQVDRRGPKGLGPGRWRASRGWQRGELEALRCPTTTPRRRTPTGRCCRPRCTVSVVRGTPCRPA